MLVAVVGCVQGEWGRGGGYALGDWIVVVMGAHRVLADPACRFAPSGYAFAAHAGT